MNVLIVSIYGVGSYSKGIMAEVLQTELDKKNSNNYFYVSCSKSFDTCYFNKDKEMHRCDSCRYSIQNTLELIDGDFTNLKISDIAAEEDIKTATEFFQDNPAISKGLFFENYDLGEATLSTYISLTRDKELNFIDQNSYVAKIAYNCLITYLSIKRFIKNNAIELIYNFNGRQDYLRAVFRAAQSMGVKCLNVERARPGGFIEFYENALPFSILAKKKLIDDFWNESPDSIQVKEDIASEFFEKKRGGLETITRVYTKSQEKNYLPAEIRNGKPNIVLFNSSDDEHAAVGDEYKNSYWENQNEGILYLVNLFGTELRNYNLIIRMHPNLSNVKHDYTTSVLELDRKFENIFVIGPDDKVDTYALIDISEKIITFGSTVGLEGTYWGKPVILLGKGRYYYSDVAYVPDNVAHIKSLISSPLKVKDKVNSLIFGYYYTKGGVKASYYFQKGVFTEVYFKNRNLSKFKPYQKLHIYSGKLIDSIKSKMK